MFTVYGIIFVISCITLLHMLYKACLEESESVSADHMTRNRYSVSAEKILITMLIQNSDFIGKTHRIIIRILIEITK